MTSAAQEASQELRSELLEVLKQLNRDEMEEGEVPGLEVEELRRLLCKGPLPQITDAETRRAIEVLVGNGYARELSDARYAWNRGRTVADRFTITTDGKAFLVRALERVGRV